MEQFDDHSLTGNGARRKLVPVAVGAAVVLVLAGCGSSASSSSSTQGNSSAAASAPSVAVATSSPAALASSPSSSLSASSAPSQTAVTQLEAGYPIFAYHTTPKCIIQIDRQNLSAGRNQRTQTSRDEQGNGDLALCA